MRSLRSLCLALGSIYLFSAAIPSTAAASATSVRLLLPVESVKPGDSFLAGLEMTMKPGWHTYWRNGGDSGAATTLDWKLPEGVTVGPIRWPIPERYEEAGFVTYVFHDTAVLLIPVTFAPSVAAGPIELAATVKWLECEKLCLPGQATVRARVDVSDATRASSYAPLLQAAEARLPQPLPAGAASAMWDGPATGDERTLVIRWPDPGGTGMQDFFPDSSTAFEVGTATVRGPEAGTFRKTVRKFEGDWPTKISGLLARVDARGKAAKAFEVGLAVGDVAEGGVPSRGAASVPSPESTTPRASGDVDPAVGAAPTTLAGAPRIPVLGLGKAIWLGLLGGLILNIMPCVLPVIALKILGFVRQSGNRPEEIRKLGLVYGLGVWFSFLVLAGSVISVKKAVGFASWGMQFGNPVFLVAMTTLVLLVALSLFGVYEINVGGRALDAAGGLAQKEGAAGAFFNGMLAVALATPCTAPFLAPALGYAFAADTVTILVVFTAIAAGLASPYVVLSWQPGWLKVVPKPGPWMGRFKVAMGFPMLATALWLYTIAANRFGDAGPLWLGLFLVGIGLAAWVWGEFVQRSTRRQTAGMIVALAVAGLFYFVTLESELRWRSPRAASDTPRAGLGNPTDPEKIAWQSWSPGAVEAARKSGRPVFVDFTADWCLTCRANERTSIEIASVREKLRAIGAATLKGDYTELPPAITQELLRHGRAGVPLVLVYPKDAAREPLVLPAFLTPGIVLEALEAAVR